MAHFKTAWMQKEQVLDVKVAADVAVGDLVKVDVSTNTLSKATNLTDAQYIVAQSDMTMEYGHIPVEQHDYRYSPKVAASTSVTKKVAVFFITDKSDVIV